MAPNHIYQYSLLNALMDGVCTTGISPSTLLSRGTQGLGTFARMNGELVMLDGKVYQLLSGGKIRETDASDIIPFAVATEFAAQEEDSEVAFQSKTAVRERLERFAPGARNNFLTYRIDGRFDYVKARTVAGQEYAGAKLAELGDKQTIEEYEDVEGSIVGFLTPKNWQGFGVAGEHLHFIDTERSKGGHVLDVRARKGQVTMRMARACNVHVELPDTEEFNQADLVTDDAGVKKVEG